MQTQTHTYISLMREFTKEHKTLLIGYIIVLISMPVRDIGIPHVIGKLLESLRMQKPNYKYIYILLGFIVLIQFAQSINDFIEIRMYPLFQKFICTKILDYVFEMSSINLQEIFTGRILSIMAHAPRTMYNYMEGFRRDIIPQVVVFLVAIVYISSINLKLGGILCIVIVIYYILAFGTMNNCKEPARKREEYLIQVNEQVDDVLMNVVGIINAGEKTNELNTMGTYYDMYQKYSQISMNCTMKYKFILVPILLMSLLAFVLIGYNLVSHKKLKIENFIVSVIIYLYVFNSILKTIDDFRDTALRGGMVKEHLKIFDSMHEPSENNSPLTNLYRDKYIYFDNINLSYGDKPILKDFSLEIKKGEKLLIIGQIGSGKTTILKLLMRYNTAASGHIYVNGTPLDVIPRDQIRKKIGYIPQNPILFNRTLYENITYGTENVSKQNVMNLIHTLGLGDIFNESRLDQRVGKHGGHLSGGQRQVVWILRVLVNAPDILLMDEPTSAIDKETKGFIDRLFEIVMKDRTVIIVSHDDYMTKFADRTVEMP